MSRRAVTVWLTDAEFAKVDGVAERLKVETGALCRLAIASGIVLAGHEVSAGEVRLRARSSRVPVPVAAAEEASAEQVPGSGSPRATSVRGSSSRSASPQRSRVDVVRGGRMVGQGTAEVTAAGYPVAETLEVEPPVDRVSAFRRATQR